MTTTISTVEMIETARSAQSAWAGLAVNQRCRVMRSLRHAIAENTEMLVTAISNDIGKPRLDSLTGDVLVTLEIIKYYERIAGYTLAAREIEKSALFFPGARFHEVFEPHGVALVIAPWNYPLQLAVVPAITALFAGNSAILKFSEYAPRTAEMFAEVLKGSNVPENLLQISYAGPEFTASLIDARPDIIFFTGSSTTGRKVARLAGELLIPTILELGGKDACIVFADCNFERTVEGVLFGAFANAGQVCVSAKRIYVEQPIFRDFLRALSERANQLRVGSGAEADAGVPLREADRQLTAAQIQDAIRRGAERVSPDSQVDGYAPVILANVPQDARILQEESFGPVTCVGAFESEEEAVAMANASAFGLGSSVWTSDVHRATRVARRLAAGSCTINDAIRHIGNPAAAFGGNRDSGYGRYHGPDGLYAFSRKKTIMTLPASSGKERNWFPFSERTFRQVQGLITLRHGRGNLLARLQKCLSQHSKPGGSQAERGTENDLS